MSTSYGALCTDFSISHKLSLKMDLPGDRETILHLMDRVRKSAPAMTQFHPFDNELVLESPRRDREYLVLGLGRRQVRTAIFNPPSMTKGYQFHKLVLEVVPYHLTISPLDVDSMDLTFGFDLECKGNHDEVVYDALYAGGPLGELIKIDGTKILDVQPYFNFALNDTGTLQAFFEVKTRNRGRKGSTGRFRHEPISLFLTIRKFGPIDTIEDLQGSLKEMGHQAESLATERFVPQLLMPISRQITSGST